MSEDGEFPEQKIGGNTTNEDKKRKLREQRQEEHKIGNRPDIPQTNREIEMRTLEVQEELLDEVREANKREAKKEMPIWVFIALIIIMLVGFGLFYKWHTERVEKNMKEYNERFDGTPFKQFKNSP